MGTTLHVKGWAAYDARTGDRLGPPRYTPQMAEKDAEDLRKKGTEAIAKQIGELRG